jgi:L-glutamine---4-(methylsulfanyl)-2-oxobutanoate aminotransferase
VRARPDLLERLPQQYFGTLVGRVAAAAAEEGEPLLDLGRGNPDVGPPAHVVERLIESARDAGAHGYTPFRGLPALREAIADRYRDVYGVELDPDREVAIVPGTKTAIVELALCLAERGETILLADPWYPDYASGPALAGAELRSLPLDPDGGWAPDLDSAPSAAAVYLNYPSNPCAVCVPDGVFAAAVRYAERTGAAIVHDFAYGDLVFDGRAPRSFLAEPGAKEVGVELFSMSKSYGMAGWRVGFVLGNAEIVERINMLNDHARVGIFGPVQEASIAALGGPQGSIAERTAVYERRRRRVSEQLAAPLSDGTYYVWLRLPEEWPPDRLLSEQRVAIAPGEGFGPGGTGWARISVSVSDDVLDEGLERLAAVLA